MLGHHRLNPGHRTVTADSGNVLVNPGMLATLKYGSTAVMVDRSQPKISLETFGEYCVDNMLLLSSQQLHD